VAAAPRAAGPAAAIPSVSVPVTDAGDPGLPDCSTRRSPYRMREGQGDPPERGRRPCLRL